MALPGVASTQKDPSTALEWVRLCVTSEPVAYVESENVTGSQLLEWLEEVSGGKVFELPLR